jgi:hypothetical protein
MLCRSIDLFADLSPAAQQKESEKHQIALKKREGNKKKLQISLPKGLEGRNTVSHSSWTTTLQVAMKRQVVNVCRVSWKNYRSSKAGGMLEQKAWPASNLLMS